MDLRGGWGNLDTVAFDPAGRLSNPNDAMIKSAADSLKQSFLLAEHIYDRAFSKRGR